MNERGSILEASKSMMGAEVIDVPCRSRSGCVLSYKDVLCNLGMRPWPIEPEPSPLPASTLTKSRVWWPVSGAFLESSLACVSLTRSCATQLYRLTGLCVMAEEWKSKLRFRIFLPVVGTRAESSGPTRSARAPRC